MLWGRYYLKIQSTTQLNIITTPILSAVSPSEALAGHGSLNLFLLTWIKKTTMQFGSSFIREFLKESIKEPP